MSTSARIAPRRRVARAVALTVVAAVILLVIGYIADTFAASRAEHRIAVALERSSGIDYEPEVGLGGFPFLTHASSGEFGSMLISARGVAFDGHDDTDYDSTATVDARLGDVDTGRVWDVTPQTELTAQSVTAETRINSVNLGRLMGILDLYINTPAPDGKVGGGGPGDGLLERSEGVMLSGTVPLPGSPEHDHGLPPSASGYHHPKVKISVKARLSVVDGRVRIEATDLYDGPEDHYSADLPKEFYSHVLKRFSTTVPVLPMAWDVIPKKAMSRGSDLVVTGERGPGALRVDDYSPAIDPGA
ncbi:LmeA family phospholipid-binding protein [Gordonia zhaorongruii]|uniref:LmeA family phospholipid-binding protein n=1 Tax=Gordonia zhaorongruii TaxID=2597659 RepID=UPI00105124C3|nr:DUF2993 domain-containing protein [Gordonia zhaorongruii]